MLPTEFSFPVSMDVSVADVLQGIVEIEGLLSYASESLTIEYQTNGMFSRTSPVAVVDVPLDSLREVIFKRRPSGSKITLRPKRLSAFASVPISSNAEIVLKVKRAHRKDAEALVAHLQRVISYKSTPGEQIRIPFRGPNVGLRQIKGFLYLEDDEFLVLDVRNALRGGFDANGQLIKVAPRALQEVELAEGRIRDRLCIRPKNPDLLEAMPGSYKDELRLKTHRQYREQIARLQYELARLETRDPSRAETATDSDEPSGGPDLKVQDQ